MRSALGRNATACSYTAGATRNAARPDGVSVYVKARRLSSVVSSSQPDEASRRSATRRYPGLAPVCSTSSAKETGAEASSRICETPLSDSAFTVGATAMPARW